MKYVVKYAIERELEINVNNFNEAYDIADENKKKDEVIVSIRIRQKWNGYATAEHYWN